jgi:hypothetical protein
VTERYDDDMIVMVHNPLTGSETYYDAECANELNIQGDAFDPYCEVQENGPLPYMQCEVCGCDLTEPAYVEGD